VALSVTDAAAESHVVDAVDLDRLLADLDDLVRIRSVGGDESPAQRQMAALLRHTGLEVDEWQIDLDALRGHPAFCEEVERSEALGVVARLGGDGDGPTLLFDGHVDVVGAGALDEWTVPPWELTVRDGRAFGRGAVDMKGGLLCALEAVRSIQRAGIRLAGDLLIASVIGEEDGGTGTLAILERGHHADAAVIMEPTRLAVAPAHAGALNFRVVLHGEAAHGCVRYEGVSAISMLPTVLEALDRLETERNARLVSPLFAGYRVPFGISVGRVAGGDWPSTVAERAVLEGRYGVAPGEHLDAARAELEEAVRRAAEGREEMRRRPPTVEWWGGRFEPAAIASDAAITTAVAEAYAAVAGRPARIEAMPYGADMRLLTNVGGIDTVMFGPGDVRAAHRPDEHVPISDLRIATRALAVTAMRFCGVAG
jgi:acetylornithine deacetylase